MKVKDDSTNFLGLHGDDIPRADLDYKVTEDLTIFSSTAAAVICGNKRSRRQEKSSDTPTFLSFLVVSFL